MESYHNSSGRKLELGEIRRHRRGRKRDRKVEKRDRRKVRRR